MSTTIEEFEKYAKSTADAIEAINGFTKIVLKYNEAFNRELDYKVKIMDSDKKGYKCKVTFNLKTNGKK